MRFKLIYPRPPKTIDSVYRHSRFVDGFIYICDKLAGTNMYTPGKKMFLVPPMNLMLLAALTPPDVQVDILDERIGPIDFEEYADLIGITCMTPDSVRAYEIADEYRRRGVKVVLGGIHPTVYPDEAAKHADSIVIGEAEHVMENLLEDTKTGKMRKFYSSSALHNLQDLPLPRRDLLKAEYYITRNVIQTTRGCPHRCSFCSISLVAGPKYRCRPINDVIREIEQMDSEFVSFVDDNVNGNMVYAKQLFHALEPLKIKWFGDATVLLGENKEMLSLAAKSGCKVLLMGFESLSQSILNNINKKFNKIDHFYDIIQRIHDHGIGIIGSFILGLDGDTIEQFDRIINFANRTNLDLVQVSILTPYPGTELFEEMEKEGRLLTKDWNYYDTTRGNIVFQPQGIDIAELQAGYYRVYDELYSLSSIAKRLIGSRSFSTLFVPYNFRQKKKIKMAKKQKMITGVSG